ncbi:MULTISPECIES: SpoIIE family protein phosphatase [unclassified Streptomyces]|uniref:SpoIIE family protein phosphatase n=1 Tax=Streptomyces sp. NBC_00119 TaxID=2975659 RepID=A0AAU1TXV5_9ACTN|nr:MULTISPECIES: SpoIIE family protein phosphatase [unclassified Streptomyces]MCX4648724.1 SpoIIE family protein phosphatase [Streptomyces sp. NBC_01446]MCX5323158.1 SpoIIE family protein phosphatase [Streptomyces sp. NBC_00120]
MAVTFAVALRTGLHRIVDVAWGIGFTAVALVSYVMSAGDGDPGRRLLVTVLTAVWGLRLALHIARRGRGHGEDPRYERCYEPWPWTPRRGTAQLLDVDSVAAAGPCDQRSSPCVISAGEDLLDAHVTLRGCTVDDVGLRRRLGGLWQRWQPSHALVMLPLALIVVITVVDILVPADVHLGPLLVVAPALTASFAGPRLTAFIGALAIGAQAFIGIHFGVLNTRNVMVQVFSLAVLSALIVFFCRVREHRRQELARARSVAEAAQKALLRPLPHHIGPLRIASLYLAAEDEAEIGGDLYTATGTDDGVRMIIGDVRGHGLSAVGESALLLGAFRVVADQHSTLPALAVALDRSVSRYLADFIEAEDEIDEHFITALLLEIPSDGHTTRMTCCGHPPPLLLHEHHVRTLTSPHPAPPLGLAGLPAAQFPVDEFAFDAGDTLILYTDGVTEARDEGGVFYPFAQRVEQWTTSSPEKLLDHIHRDLLAHCRGHLSDDAAIIAIRRNTTPWPGGTDR